MRPIKGDLLILKSVKFQRISSQMLSCLYTGHCQTKSERGNSVKEEIESLSILLFVCLLKHLNYVKIPY